MITIQNIQCAISKVLTDNGHTVTANEIQEGFIKPTFFLDLFQNSTEVQNKFHELVNVGVEIKYIPAVETREELVITAEVLKALFLTTPLAVEDCQTGSVRFLTVPSITFDIDTSNLLTYFELEFFKERNMQEKEYEKIENIEIGGLENGTSTGSN